jgi:PAS domain S-box-containing protein
MKELSLDLLKSELTSLRKQIRELSYILRKVPGYVFWKDKNSILQGCNENFAKQAGLKDPNEIVGKSDYDLPWNQEETASFLRDDKEIMKTGKEKLNIEELQCQHDGRQATLLTSKVPLKDEQGNVTGVLGIYVDITDRKRTEALERENFVKDERMKTLELTAACFAHEIRHPLQIYRLGMSRLITSLEKGDKDTMQKAIQSVVADGMAAVKSAETYTSVTLMKFRTFREGLAQENFKESKILDDAKKAVSMYPFKSSERKLLKIIPGNEFKYFGEPVYTEHILLNLIRNALYFIAEAAKGEITISFEQGKDFNKMIFTDTAKGVSPEDMKKLFTPLFTTTRMGTGLGLAFCKMVMDGYGGDITCESVEGEYTKFIMTFPKIP